MRDVRTAPGLSWQGGMSYAGGCSCLLLSFVRKRPWTGTPAQNPLLSQHIPSFAGAIGCGVCCCKADISGCSTKPGQLPRESMQLLAISHVVNSAAIPKHNKATGHLEALKVVLYCVVFIVMKSWPICRHIWYLAQHTQDLANANRPPYRRTMARCSSLVEDDHEGSHAQDIWHTCSSSNPGDWGINQEQPTRCAKACCHM